MKLFREEALVEDVMALTSEMGSYMERSGFPVVDGMCCEGWASCGL
jgi:hypothetical protein